MDKASRQEVSELLNSSRVQTRVTTDPGQERLTQEMQAMEGELKDQYDSHVAFLDSIGSVKEAEVQRLRTQFDRILSQNAQKEGQLRLLKVSCEDEIRTQKDVIPLSQRLRPNTSATSLRVSLRTPQTSASNRIPVLVERTADLQREVTAVEQRCLLLEAESECILQKLSSEKAATVLSILADIEGKSAAG